MDELPFVSISRFVKFTQKCPISNLWFRPGADPETSARLFLKCLTGLGAKAKGVNAQGHPVLNKELVQGRKGGRIPY